MSRGKRGDFIGRSIMSALSFLQETVFADEYASKRGFLQARDPRLKSFFILVLLLAVLFTKDIRFLLGMYIFCLFLARVSSIGLGMFLKRTWVFIPIFALFIAVPAVFITEQGPAAAAIFFMRVLTSVSLCVLLALTTRHYALLKTLRTFGIPQVFVMTLGMCYRYIYLFIDIIRNTYLAVKSRVGYVSSVKKGQGVVAWNMGGLWQRSYALHTHVYDAMISRGYTGEPKAMEEFRAAPKDWLLIAVSLLIFGVSLWQNRFLS